jgi:hypothetical protein
MSKPIIMYKVLINGRLREVCGTSSIAQESKIKFEQVGKTRVTIERYEK